MMRIDIISVHPPLFESFLSHSIIKRAANKGLLFLHIHNLRDYADNKHKNVDDYQYGGGAGMVMTAPPIAACIEKLIAERTYDEIIYMTPDGDRLNQQAANELSLNENILILCGHYKGIDQRIRELFITREISIGDYVLSGGELPAAVLVDAIGRLLPGVLNDESSALTDSFQDGLLSGPIYSRPSEFRGLKVPEVLLSGDPKEIEKWRFEQSLEKTTNVRPDLLL